MWTLQPELALNTSGKGDGRDQPAANTGMNQGGNREARLERGDDRNRGKTGTAPLPECELSSLTFDIHGIVQYTCWKELIRGNNYVSIYGAQSCTHTHTWAFKTAAVDQVASNTFLQINLKYLLSICPRSARSGPFCLCLLFSKPLWMFLRLNMYSTTVAVICSTNYSKHIK